MNSEHLLVNIKAAFCPTFQFDFLKEEYFDKIESFSGLDYIYSLYAILYTVMNFSKTILIIIDNFVS